MTTKPKNPLGLTGLADQTFSGITKAFKGSGKKAKKQPKVVSASAGDAPIKLMKVSHAMTLIYIALLLAFSIVAVQNNRIRKAHDELLKAHDALYVETQVLRLEAADITSPMAIRTWAKNQGMVPYYSSEMELEQLEPIYLNRGITQSINTTAQIESTGQ